MESQGGEAWVFNTMVQPSAQPEESNKEGISLEEKVMVRATGKIHPNKKGGTGRKPTPQKWNESGKGARVLYSATWGKPTQRMLKRKRSNR